MPIKSLETHLFERGLVGSYPIEALKNATLGIDVNHYISRLLTSKREQFLDAIGGFPTSLKLYLESDLKIFEEYNITPVFVFNGSMVSNQLETSGIYPKNGTSSPTGNNPNLNVDPLGNQGSKTNRDSILAQRHRAWTQWNNLMNSNQQSYIDQPIQPQEPFRYNTTIDTTRFYGDLIKYFIENNIIYQVAPYNSWSQLAYLLRKEYIDAIYGPTDCFMLKSVNKFILGMEFPNREFRFIDKNKILKDFNITHDEFVDISMAVGNALQPTTLPPLQIYPFSQLFEVALEMVLTSATNFYAYQLSNPLKNESAVYIEKYQKGFASLRFMPVLTDSGKVEVFIDEDYKKPNEDSSDNNKKSVIADKSNPSSSNSNITEPMNVTSLGKFNQIPNDVHDFIAQRLPHEYYFYKSLGIIDGKLLDTITTGVYPEEPPLDGGSTNSYRNLVKNSVPMFKNKEINLLTSSINRYYQIKQIKQVKWFAQDDPVVLTNRQTPSIFEQLNHLVVKTDSKKDFSISELITILCTSKNLAEDFISNDVLFPNSVPTEKKLSTEFDLLATNYLRLLYSLEFFEFDFTKKILKPTAWGSVLLKFNELQISKESQESLLILMVFLKMNVLGISEETQPSISSALSQVTLRSYPIESSYILLITRLLSLFQIEQRPSNYHGPIDKKTLVFRDHLDFVKTNVKELYEATIVASLTSGEFNRLGLTDHDWRNKVVGNLPFKISTPNTIMSMMWEFFLQKFLHNGNAKIDALALVASEFTTYKSTPNLEEQFDKSLSFLEQTSILFKELSSQNLVKQSDSVLLEKAAQFARQAIESE